MTSRDSPVINDKLMAYAFILTHEGYPCVFWQDYFNWNLSPPGNQSGIDALIKVHEQNAAGPTQVLFVDDDLYIMQSPGLGNQSGLIFQDFLITRIFLPFTRPYDVMTRFLELLAGSAPDAGVQKKSQELVKEVSRTGFSE